MLYKEDWEKSKQRFEALWRREIIDRCCISVTAPKKGCKPYRAVFPEKYEDIVRYWTDPEWILDRNAHRMERTYFGGDAIPMIWLNLGPDALAADFGCPYTFAENTVWFDAILHDWDTDMLAFNPQSELLRKTQEIARVLAREGKDKFFVSMPDNASAVDTLAHIRGSESLLADFIQEPERLKTSLKIITDMWLETNEKMYKTLMPCNEDGSCIGWLNTWAPGRHAQLQCDLSVMISPDFYREFVMEELDRACDSMDHPLYHFDGIEQLRHLDILMSIDKLDMIQWTSVEGQPPVTEFIPALWKIQAAGKGLLLNVRAEYVETLLSNLSPKGLYVVTNTETEEDARDLVRLAEAAVLGR